MRIGNFFLVVTGCCVGLLGSGCASQFGQVVTSSHFCSPGWHEYHLEIEAWPDCEYRIVGCKGEFDPEDNPGKTVIFTTPYYRSKDGDIELTIRGGVKPALKDIAIEQPDQQPFLYVLPAPQGSLISFSGMTTGWRVYDSLPAFCYEKDGKKHTIQLFFELADVPDERVIEVAKGYLQDPSLIQADGKVEVIRSDRNSYRVYFPSTVEDDSQKKYYSMQLSRNLDLNCVGYSPRVW